MLELELHERVLVDVVRFEAMAVLVEVDLGTVVEVLKIACLALLFVALVKHLWPWHRSRVVEEHLPRATRARWPEDEQIYYNSGASVFHRSGCHDVTQKSKALRLCHLCAKKQEQQ